MSRNPMSPFDDKEFPQKTMDNLKNGIADVKDQVADLSAKARDKASQVAGNVSDKLGQSRESAAEGLDWAASTLHEKAEAVPGGPKAVNLTHSLAEGIESTASYLRDNDLKKMGNDVMNICRRYPTQALVAALAVGFLVGRSRR